MTVRKLRVENDALKAESDNLGGERETEREQESNSGERKTQRRERYVKSTKSRRDDRSEIERESVERLSQSERKMRKSLKRRLELQNVLRGSGLWDNSNTLRLWRA